MSINTTISWRTETRIRTACEPHNSSRNYLTGIIYIYIIILLYYCTQCNTRRGVETGARGCRSPVADLTGPSRHLPRAHQSIDGHDISRARCYIIIIITSVVYYYYHYTRVPIQSRVFCHHAHIIIILCTSQCA